MLKMLKLLKGKCMRFVQQQVTNRYNKMAKHNKDVIYADAAFELFVDFLAYTCYTVFIVFSLVSLTLLFKKEILVHLL